MMATLYALTLIDSNDSNQFLVLLMVFESTLKLSKIEQGLHLKIVKEFINVMEEKGTR